MILRNLILPFLPVVLFLSSCGVSVSYKAQHSLSSTRPLAAYRYIDLVKGNRTIDGVIE